jgi:hypothetical protein
LLLNQVPVAEALGIVVLGFLIGFWFLPGGVLALRRRAHGELQVDLRLGYSPATLYRLLQLYGLDGLRSFRRMLWADMIFPAVYAALLLLVGNLIAVRHPAAVRTVNVVYASALLAASFDYAENFLLLYVLQRLPEARPLAARSASVCTCLKMLSFIVALGAVASALTR